MALVIDHLDSGRGGGEGYASALAKGLLQLGHQVHVFAHSFKGELQGIRTHHLPMMRYPRGAKALSLCMAARGRLRRESFDIVQGFGATWEVDVHRPGGGSERAWLAREMASHPPGWRRWWAWIRLRVSWKLATNLWIESRLYGKGGSHMVVANSFMVASDIMKSYPRMDPSRIRVIPNGVDINKFHPEHRNKWRVQIRQQLGLSRDDVVMLFLAHNFRLKGLGCLLSALKEPMPGRFVLLVAGRGKKGAYELKALRSGIRVIFLGPVQKPQLLMSAADMLVHPTFYDPCANVCIEAMASGLPVITTTWNGASELLEDGVSGYLVSDPRSASLLRDRILALGDEVLRNRMGEAARKAAERISMDWHLAQMERLYLGVAGLNGSDLSSAQEGKNCRINT